MFLKLRLFPRFLSLSFSWSRIGCCLFWHFFCRDIRIFLTGFAWRRLNACVYVFVRFSICISFSSAFSYIYIKRLKLIFVWVCVVGPCSMPGNRFALIWLRRESIIFVLSEFDAIPFLLINTIYRQIICNMTRELVQYCFYLCENAKNRASNKIVFWIVPLFPMVFYSPETLKAWNFLFGILFFYFSAEMFVTQRAQKMNGLIKRANTLSVNGRLFRKSFIFTCVINLSTCHRIDSQKRTYNSESNERGIQKKNRKRQWNCEETKKKHFSNILINCIQANIVRLSCYSAKIIWWANHVDKINICAARIWMRVSVICRRRRFIFYF